MKYTLFEIPTKINSYWVYNTEDETFVMNGKKRLELNYTEANKYVKERG